MADHIVRMTRIPIFTALLLCTNGCVKHWETRDLGQVRRDGDVGVVRITQDGRETVLEEPRFVGDSVQGIAVGPVECTRPSFSEDRFRRRICRRSETPTSVALGDVDRVQVRGVDELASAGAALGAAVAVLFVIWRITCDDGFIC